MQYNTIPHTQAHGAVRVIRSGIPGRRADGGRRTRYRWGHFFYGGEGGSFCPRHHRARHPLPATGGGGRASRQPPCVPAVRGTACGLRGRASIAPAPRTSKVAAGRTMHILVTGAAGLVGQTVCSGLSARGHRIRAHDQREAAVHTLAARLLHEQDTAIEPMAGDVGSLADMRAAVAGGVEVVVHLGGSPGLTGSEDPAYAHSPSDAGEWETILSANIVGTRNVLEAAAQSAACRRVVYASRAGETPLAPSPSLPSPRRLARPSGACWTDWLNYGCG